MKRTFDLLITLLLFLPSLVVMGAIAIAIRLEGPGAILLRHQRVGENGRLFKIIKFRTMVPEADNFRHLVEHYDEVGRLIRKAPGDPRVTWVGLFLRKTSLDELAQFFNILQGEMSLVSRASNYPTGWNNMSSGSASVFPCRKV